MSGPRRATAPFRLDDLRRRLAPLRVVYRPVLRSTSDHAARLRRRRTLFAPAMVLTARQTAGRGRAGNAWWSAEGNLAVTFVLPIDEALAPHHVPLVAGLAARDALAAVVAEDRVLLKWPNDLLIDGRKVAGLLCERIEGIDLIGLGVNVNAPLSRLPRALRSSVTSLSRAAGQRVDLTDLLVGLARSLRLALDGGGEHPFAVVRRRYDRHHALLGRDVRVSTADGVAAGICRGLDSMGRLVVGDGAARRRILSGQVLRWGD